MSIASDKVLKLLSTVDGRDKFYKTVQYGARTAWWITHSKDPKNAQLPKLQALDSVLSEARRAFRLGGFVREYKDFVVCKNSTDISPMGRFKMVNHLGNCIGETMDVIIWCAKLKVVNVSKERWEWWRNVLWMINVLYTLTDQYLLFKQTWKVYSQLQPHTGLPDTKKEASFVEDKLRAFILVFARYIADFFLCSAMLCDYNHKGYMGILGSISGLSGVISTWRKL